MKTCKLLTLLCLALISNMAQSKDIIVVFMSRMNLKKVSQKSPKSINLIKEVHAQNLDFINGETGSLPPIDAINTDLPHCDPKSHHSFFCPPKNPPKKGVKKLPPKKIEVFIDISSSFQFIDPLEKGSCARKNFALKTLNRYKKANVKITPYNTKVFSYQNPDHLCQVVGLNSKEKLIKWIKESRSSKIIVVTDVYEYEKKFYDDLKEMKAKFYGDKTDKIIDRQNIVDLVSEINL